VVSFASLKRIWNLSNCAELSYIPSVISAFVTGREMNFLPWRDQKRIVSYITCRLRECCRKWQLQLFNSENLKGQPKMDVRKRSLIFALPQFAIAECPIFHRGANFELSARASSRDAEFIGRQVRWHAGNCTGNFNRANFSGREETRALKLTRCPDVDRIAKIDTANAPSRGNNGYVFCEPSLYRESFSPCEFNRDMPGT